MSAPVKEVPQIEAIKYALRQSKDGTVVSFVIHPNDVDHALQCLPIGARVMFGWYEITDDEKPTGRAANGSAAEGNDSAADAMDETAHRSGSGSSPGRPPKPKRKFAEMSLPEQCGVRCADGNFYRFLSQKWDYLGNDFDVAEAVRGHLGIPSRADLSRNHNAANKWRRLETEFQQWLTDETHGGSLNR